MKKQQIANALVHVVLGIVFLLHGLAKFNMGLGNVAGFFGSMGLPGFLGYLVAYLELLGGIALIVGFAVRYVSIVFVLIMLGAIVKVKLSAGLLGDGQAPGYELELSLLVMAAYLAIAGVKGFVDRMIAKKSE